MSIVAADVTGDDGKGEGDGPVGLGCRMGMWEQSPVGGSSGGAACSLVSLAAGVCTRAVVFHLPYFPTLGT